LILRRRHKPSRVRYYLGELPNLILPRSYFARRLDRIGRRIGVDDPDVADRIDYYNRIGKPFGLPEGPTIAEFRRERRSTYHLDLAKHLRIFDSNLRVRYVFGDVIDVPPVPSFVKSRPIQGDNQNAVLMPLDHARHFVFVRDRIPFEAKQDGLSWRGVIHRHNPRERRREFLEKFQGHPSFDVGHVGDDPEIAHLRRPFLSIDQQLQRKFVLSLEGNDVATNMKWIMSSQSACVACRPRYETWFMEGLLKPGIHYIEVADDFSNLETQLHHYATHPEETRRIIAAANEWVARFTDPDRESLIAHQVARRFFELSGQLPARP
jgi:hypothetical protein